MDCEREFQKVVNWLVGIIEERHAPGFLVGISGTDSVLTFLACAAAWRKVGKPERVLGVHYGLSYDAEALSPERLERLLQLNPSYRWIPRIVLPWLREKAPEAQIVHDSRSEISSDFHIWAELLHLSVNRQSSNLPVLSDDGYWVVGTRNRTEDVLGTYSSMSKAASLLPIVGLWKSDVLALCRWLQVPEVAVAQSRVADCDCGRFDLAAENIEALDDCLKEYTGVCGVSTSDLLRGRVELRKQLENFIQEQLEQGSFKRITPYRP